MRILVLSDLHLELGTSLTLADGLAYDVAVLAGDIHSPGHKAVHWAQRESTFGGRPVIIVPGNHEFYGREMSTELGLMRKATVGSNVHVLSRNSVTLDGVTFSGCTLWTDFCLPVLSTREDSSEIDVARALEVANVRLRDFELIDLAIPQRRGRPVFPALRRQLTAEDTLAMHHVDRDWLRRAALTAPPCPRVVITHHAPALGSVARRYARDWLTPAFVSDLPSDLFTDVALWIHGHTHSPFDYVNEGCRVVSNPRGYRLRDGSFENSKFDRSFVVSFQPEQKNAKLEERQR